MHVTVHLFSNRSQNVVRTKNKKGRDCTRHDISISISFNEIVHICDTDIFMSVRDTATSDSYPKCKLKYNYEEKDCTCIRNSTLGGFYKGLRSHSNFRVFACKQGILSRCFCCRLFALSSYQTNTIHCMKLTRQSPLQCRFVWLLYKSKDKISQIIPRVKTNWIIT